MSTLTIVDTLRRESSMADVQPVGEAAPYVPLGGVEFANAILLDPVFGPEGLTARLIGLPHRKSTIVRVVPAVDAPPPVGPRVRLPPAGPGARLAAFDFDDTLSPYKSRVDAAGRAIDPEMTIRFLRGLASTGWDIAIFSNRGCLKPRSIARVAGYLGRLARGDDDAPGISFRAYLLTGDVAKPSPAVWALYAAESGRVAADAQGDLPRAQNCLAGVLPPGSFFCGDAGGGSGEWGAADRWFAHNGGVRFLVPAQLYSGMARDPPWPLSATAAGNEAELAQRIAAAVDSDGDDGAWVAAADRIVAAGCWIVILVGEQGAGKSAFARLLGDRYGYARYGEPAAHKPAEGALGRYLDATVLRGGDGKRAIDMKAMYDELYFHWGGRPLVFDRTHPTRASREEVARLYRLATNTRTMRAAGEPFIPRLDRYPVAPPPNRPAGWITGGQVWGDGNQRRLPVAIVNVLTPRFIAEHLRGARNERHARRPALQVRPSPYVPDVAVAVFEKAYRPAEHDEAELVIDLPFEFRAPGGAEGLPAEVRDGRYMRR